MVHTPPSFPAPGRSTLAALSAAALTTLLLVAAAPAIAQTAAAAAEQALQARVARILAATPLIDGHNDLPENYKERVDDHLDRIDIAGDTSSLARPLHTDIPRLRRGGVGGQFWSVFVPTTLAGPPAAVAVLEQIDLVHRMIARYPETFAFAATAADVERIHRSGRDRLPDRHGGRLLDRRLARRPPPDVRVRRALHDPHPLEVDRLGRCRHRRAPARRPHPLRAGGRARDGTAPGMLVDLSHVSDQGMLDARPPARRR